MKPFLKFIRTRLFSLFFIISLLVFIKSSDEPVCSFLQGSYLEELSLRYENFNDIYFLISSGILVSTIFYFINVFIPKMYKIRYSKKSLRLSFQYLKKRIIATLLSALFTGVDYSLVDQLAADEDKCREFFCAMADEEMDDTGIGKPKWRTNSRKCLERLDEYQTTDILHEFLVLKNEIQLLLSLIETEEDWVLDSFKNEVNRYTIFEYDWTHNRKVVDYKRLDSLIFPLLTNEDPISGKQKRSYFFDLIEGI